MIKYFLEYLNRWVRINNYKVSIPNGTKNKYLNDWNKLSILSINYDENNLKIKWPKDDFIRYYFII